MSNQLNRIKKLLQQDGAPTQGTVITTVSEIKISTSAGVIVGARQSGDVTNYRAGDKVRLSNGVITGKLKANTEFYVL